MAEAHDYADDQVQGLERLFPTKLSRALLFSLPILPVTTFWLIIENSNSLFPELTPIALKLLAAIAALLVAVAILLAVVVDLVTVANHAKHRRIAHFSNTHPNMSFKWLLQNAQGKHYLLVLLIFCLGTLLGNHL